MRSPTLFAFSMFLWMVASVGHAQAQVAVVRSGEHDGFSRVVVDFGSRPDWSIKNEGGAVRLSAGPEIVGYDLSRAFRLIPRTRIADMIEGPEPGILTLKLACTCSVETFESGDGAVVLDIRDPEGDAFPKVSVAPSPERIDPDFQPADISLPILFDGHANWGQDPQIEFSRPAAVGVRPLPPPSWEGGADFTGALTAELARAAAQGLLDAREDFPITGDDGGRLDQGPTIDAIERGDTSIRIRTGVDRAFDQAARAGVRESPVTSCRSDESFDVAAWGGGEEAGSQIARRRSTLLREFDIPDPYAVMGLARLYIHLSFGAEARQILQTLPIEHPDVPLILEFADLVDGVEGQKPILESQVACGGFAPLWGFLAGFEDTDVLQTEDILFTFSTLPPHLRRHFAPELAERLTEIGEHDAVDFVVANVARVLREDDPALILTQARGPVSALSPASEDDGLLRLARTVHPEASTALLLQIEELVSDGKSVPEDLVDTAAILSYERSGTADGNRLKAAEIDARTANGDVLGAFAELARSFDDRTLAGPMFERSRDRVLAAAANAATDADSARIGFHPRAPDLFRLAEPSLLAQFAERLMTLGFGARAEGYIPVGTDSTDPLFHGRVALSRGELEQALAHAQTSASQEAPRFLAEALSVAKRHEEAAAILERTGDREDWLEEAWRARDWERIAASDEGIRGQAAAMMVGLEQRPSPQAPAAPNLASSKELLSGAADLRATLEELLSNARQTEHQGASAGAVKDEPIRAGG